MVPSNRDKSRKSVASKSKPAKSNQQMQDDLVRKMPSTVDPAQEWGERIGTSKAIATIGKSGSTKRVTGKKSPPRKRRPKS